MADMVFCVVLVWLIARSKKCASFRLTIFWRWVAAARVFSLIPPLAAVTLLRFRLAR